MAKKDTAVQEEEVTVETLHKQLTELKAKVRRMSDNWKRFCKGHIGDDNDGKVGGVRVWAMAVVLVCVVVGVATATETLWQLYNGDAVHGTAKVTDDGAGAATMTVDKFVGDMTGATGNIPIASITNALATAGPNIGGNVPLASVTNALATAVIPIAGITNALATGTYAVKADGLTGNAPIAAITNALIDAIGSVQLANEDLGDITVSSGVVAVDDNAVLASEIGAGTLASDVVVPIAAITNALIDAIGADQMADADHGDVSWSSGVATVDAVNGVAAATISSGAALGATAVQPATVWGAPGVTATPATLTNSVAIQTKTAAGGNLTGFRMLQVWASETSMGAASTNNIEALTLSTGTAINTVVANAHYWYATATGGTAAAEVVGTAAGTNYLMVSDGSSITATALVFTE